MHLSFACLAATSASVVFDQSLHGLRDILQLHLSLLLSQLKLPIPA